VKKLSGWWEIVVGFKGRIVTKYWDETTFKGHCSEVMDETWDVARMATMSEKVFASSTLPL